MNARHNAIAESEYAKDAKALEAPALHHLRAAAEAAGTTLATLEQTLIHEIG
jgi:hypothetical protein